MLHVRSKWCTCSLINGGESRANICNRIRGLKSTSRRSGYLQTRKNFLGYLQAESVATLVHHVTKQLQQNKSRDTSSQAKRHIPAVPCLTPPHSRPSRAPSPVSGKCYYVSTNEPQSHSHFRHGILHNRGVAQHQGRHNMHRFWGANCAACAGSCGCTYDGKVGGESATCEWRKGRGVGHLIR